MVTFEYTVKDANGIHARPAGVLINCAKKYASDIKICKLTDTQNPMCSTEADAKRLLSVMSLGAKHGDILKFTVNGNDEKEAAEALQKCCIENIG